MAEKPCHAQFAAMVSGLQTIHLPFSGLGGVAGPMSFCGCNAGAHGTKNIRILESVALAIASLPRLSVWMPNSMLDWPDATHTSPTKTSVKAIVLFPITVKVPASLPGSIWFRLTRHVPSAVAVVVCFWFLKVTVIFSPGDAQPQMGSFDFCCKTMWSPKMAGSRTSARALKKCEKKTAIKTGHQEGRR